MSAPRSPKVLIVDDDKMIHRSLKRALRKEDYEILSATSGPEALEIIRKLGGVDLAILDLKMPGMSGTDLLEKIRRAGWDVDVMLLSGYGDIETAVRCMKLGAVDFLEKPYGPNGLRQRVQSNLKERLQRKDARQERASAVRPAPEIVGSSAAMKELRTIMDRSSGNEELVLIRGESGTGKELVARAIHAGGPSTGEPFITIDCTTLSSTVIDSELFGHVKGAFTGAERDKTGLLQAAGRGTVFFDEIAELPLEMQAKLLRAIQEREIRPIGAIQAERFEARILAASNRNLEKMMKAKRFREDLYWRINVVVIMVPPLRTRANDILLLARHFIKRFDKSPDGPRAIDPEASELLKKHDWPGNVRELENCIRRLLVLHPEGLITKELVSAQVNGHSVAAAAASMTDLEKSAIESALVKTQGNVTQAARLLEISKSTIYRKMKVYGTREPTSTE